MDKMGNKVCTWRASLLTHGGRAVLVYTTLAVIPIFTMMSLHISAKTFHLGEHGLSWLPLISAGREEARRGDCQVISSKVCSP